jgi:ADP-ribose pyrophosphatase YjhB (NUDIX family)
VRRELREEAGVEVAVGRLVATVPDFYGEGDGADPTINAFYECRITAGEPQAADDVAELQWFEPAKLPPPGELAFACVRSALALWRSGH